LHYFQFSLWDSTMKAREDRKIIHSFQFSLWDSVVLIIIASLVYLLVPFNSLYEILGMRLSKCEWFTGMYPFNSLYEIQTIYCYCEDGSYFLLFQFSLWDSPLGRVIVTFCSLVNFQFSLWDSEAHNLSDGCSSMNQSFNSLYEILNLLTKPPPRLPVYFQFSLWDSHHHTLFSL